jgi:integrase
MRLATGSLSRYDRPVATTNKGPTVPPLKEQKTMTNKPKFTFCISGKYWVFRRGKVKVSLPGQPGEAEFESRYSELVAMTEAVRASEPAKPETSSLAWLIDSYLDSVQFKVRKPRTKRDYQTTFEFIKKHLGTEPYRLVTRGMVRTFYEKVADAGTIRKAGKVRDCLCLLYSWADRRELVPEDYNPALKVEKLKVDIIHHPTWSEEEIDLYLRDCPTNLKTAILLALYTGQRISDVVEMDWTQYLGDFIRVKQSKTGTPLSLRVHPELKAHLEAVRTPFGGRMVRSVRGKPMQANALTQWVKRHLKSVAAMPQDRTMHGLRYAAAARLEEAGCSIVEITSVTGHKAYAMGMQYASQRKSATLASEKQEAYEAANRA